MARRHLLSGGSRINLGRENDDNALGSACPILLPHIMCVSFILFRTHQQRWQIGNYSLRQWAVISTTAVYCWNEVRLSVKVTCLCVLLNSSFAVAELCTRFSLHGPWRLLYRISTVSRLWLVFIALIDKQVTQRKHSQRCGKKTYLSSQLVPEVIS